MALTCKHGSRPDNSHCGSCAQEAGEYLVEQFKQWEKNPETFNCPWCGELLGNPFNPNAFEEKHMLCQKVYQRGQQWAIDALSVMKENGSGATWSHWLQEKIKKA